MLIKQIKNSLLISHDLIINSFIDYNTMNLIQNDYNLEA